MKKSALALGIVSAAVLAGARSASASLLIYEPFNYTAGQPIAGQVNPAGTWNPAGSTTPLHIVGNSSLSPSASMSLAGFPASVGNDGDLKKSGTSAAYDRINIPNAYNSDLTPKYASGSALFYSLLLDVPSISGLTIAHSNLNANNDGLVAFSNSQGSQATNPNTWVGELVIRLGSAAGTYNLGIRASTTPAGTTPTPTLGQTYWTGDLHPGDTHFVVVESQLGIGNTDPAVAANDLNSIWLDPNAANFGAALAPTADGSSYGAQSTTTANDSMQSVIIGAGITTAGAAPNDTLVDEIRVGNTWADVTPVPEPTSIGLAGIGVLGLLNRRRRTA